MNLLSRLKVAIKRRVFSPAGRDDWQRPDDIVGALGLREGDRVADLGAGTGYYTFRLARAVGPEGVVYAIDTDADLLEEIADQATDEGVTNVRMTHPGPTDAGLPEPVDAVFLSHVYHHLPQRPAYFARLARSLRPGGRVAIVEARREGLNRIWGHATNPARIRSEMEAAGYQLVATHDLVADASYQVFVPR